MGVPWVALGKDLSGFDCWGFVRYALDLNDAPIAPYFDEETRPGLIQEFKKKFVRVNDKTPYSIILMGKKGRMIHVGVYLSTGVVYHCLDRTGVCGHKLGALGTLGFDTFEFYLWGSNADHSTKEESV